MKREFPECPLIGVGAVIVENGRALLIRRATPPLLGEWSLPGGVLECCEALREAAIREAREETGFCAIHCQEKSRPAATRRKLDGSAARICRH